MLERLTRARLSDWVAPLGLSGLLLLLLLGGASVTTALRYERAAVLDGQWWRLVTGHLVHADAWHLAWNVLGIVIVWGLFAREYRLRDWLLILLASTAAIGAGFLWLEPQLEWYVGFSGLLHGAMAAGLVAWLRTARDPLTALVAVLFAAKLAWEHSHGSLPFTSATLSLPVVHQAHTYGALGGLLAALVLRPSGRAAGPSL
jgi:rhomboid family GlyGly-CTERM serine protease